MTSAAHQERPPGKTHPPGVERPVLWAGLAISLIVHGGLGFGMMAMTGTMPSSPQEIEKVIEIELVDTTLLAKPPEEEERPEAKPLPDPKPPAPPLKRRLPPPTPTPTQVEPEKKADDSAIPPVLAEIPAQRTDPFLAPAMAAAPLSPPLNPAPGRDQLLGRFAEVLWRHIQAYKPARLSAEGSVTISFTIAADGRLITAKIVSSSGNARLDGAALGSVSLAQPFPPRPRELGFEPLTFTLPFQFQARSP
ncbi:MAG: energy transducer TonB [Alphaproteobacteria bacterium]|nr:energy transducer TonB [Alphaproteobacteria bacterium]